MELERLFDVHSSARDGIGRLERGDEALEQHVGVRSKKLWPIIVKYWINGRYSLLRRGGGGLCWLVLKCSRQCAVRCTP